MLTQGQIREKIRAFLTENFLFDGELTVEDEESLQDSQVIDSAGVLTLITFIEEEFEVQVGEDEVTPENMDSILGMTQFILAKLSPSAE